LNWTAVNALSLNWVDWAIIIVLTLSTLLSLWRGFVREAMSLAAWIFASVAAGLCADLVAGQLTAVIDNATGRFLVAYVLVFVAVLVLGTVLNAVMARLIQLAGLSTLDRLLGTLFGFARGLIIVLVVVFVAQELLPVQNQQALMESEIMPQLELISHWMRSAFTRMNVGLDNGISI